MRQKRKNQEESLERKLAQENKVWKDKAWESAVRDIDRRYEKMAHSGEWNTTAADYTPPKSMVEEMAKGKWHGVREMFDVKDYAESFRSRLRYLWGHTDYDRRLYGIGHTFFEQIRHRAKEEQKIIGQKIHEEMIKKSAADHPQQPWNKHKRFPVEKIGPQENTPDEFRQYALDRLRGLNPNDVERIELLREHNKRFADFMREEGLNSHFPGFPSEKKNQSFLQGIFGWPK